MQGIEDGPALECRPAHPASVLRLYFDGWAPSQGHFLPPTQRCLISTNCTRPLPLVLAGIAPVFGDNSALAQK